MGPWHDFHEIRCHLGNVGFDAPPAAMWTAALAGKPDRPIIAALITRLRVPGDPLWLKGDAVGALTVLTGQRLAYDFDAWNAWWARTRSE